MRRLVILIALLAVAPAQAANLKVGTPTKRGVPVKVKTKTAVRLVSPLTEPVSVKRSRSVVLRFHRAGRAACPGSTLVVRAFRDRGPRRAATPAGRGSHAFECSPPAPGDVELPDGTNCDQLDPAHCLQPFPSNRFTKPQAGTDTGRRIDIPRAAMPTNRAGIQADPAELNRNDGFSPGSALITRVPGLDTQEALKKTGAVPINDLARSFDKRQPVVVIDTATGRRHPVWTELDANPEDPADRNLIVRPARNFLEGHHYVVGLRRMGAQPSAAFAALRDGVITTDEHLEGRRKQAEADFLALARAGVRRGNLFLAWDFTIASERNLTERMLHIRDDAFGKLGDTNLADMKVEGNAPAYVIDEVVENPDGAEGEILRRIDGHLEVPCYLTTPGCISGGVFTNGPGGLPEANGTATVRFTCNIPRVALDGAPLRPGIYGHGLLGSRGEVNQGQLKTLSQEYGFVFCAADWIGMACADVPDIPVPNPEDPLLVPNCDIPTVGGILLEISNFPRLADRVQQGMLNFLLLGRLMIHPDGLSQNPAFQVDGKSVINQRRLYYDGNSQGGIIGGALMAFAVDNDRGVLGVPGMNYSTLLRRSVDFDSYASILYNSYPDELERPVLLQLLQMQWDRAETNGYAQHITRDPLPNTPPHEVLLHPALGDHQVTTYSAKVAARTIGARALTPWADPGRDSDKQPLFGLGVIRGRSYAGSGIVLWDSGSPVPPLTEVPPREGQDPHEHPRRSPLSMKMKSFFLRPGGKVVDVCGGKPCYADEYKGPAR